jgi:hypothetical protein
MQTQRGRKPPFILSASFAWRSYRYHDDCDQHHDNDQFHKHEHVNTLGRPGNTGLDLLADASTDALRIL